jgi:hypothetical protein
MRTEDGGLFVGPDDGKALTNPIGGRMVAKVRDEDTGGAYSIHDNTIPPGSPGPRPHIHRFHEEAFYVLEGEQTVRVGLRTITAPAGSSWWYRGVSSTNPRTRGRSQPECCSSFPRRGWVTFLRRQLKGACRCKRHRPIQRSWRSSRPLPGSTATSLRSFRRSRRSCAEVAATNVGRTEASAIRIGRHPPAAVPDRLLLSNPDACERGGAL